MVVSLISEILSAADLPFDYASNKILATVFSSYVDKFGSTHKLDDMFKDQISRIINFIE